MEVLTPVIHLADFSKRIKFLYPDEAPAVNVALPEVKNMRMLFESAQGLTRRYCLRHETFLYVNMGDVHLT